MNNKVTFICDVCKDKSSDLIQESKFYWRVSSFEASFVCGECSKIFSMGYEVTNEEPLCNIREDIIQLDCSTQSEETDCSEKSRTQKESETIVLKESRDKPYKCNCCDKSYKSITGLYYHKNIHKGRFKCKTCNKYLSSKGNLISHMSSHSNLKPHKCSNCPKRFKYIRNFREHMNLHNKSNLLKCGLCEKNCVSKHDLKIHMIKHSDERPHQCNMCPKAYKRINNLRLHMKKHKQDALQPPRKTDVNLE